MPLNIRLPVPQGCPRRPGSAGGRRLCRAAPAFSFIQDTPLGNRQSSDFSCERFCGDANSPILMLNHWIDRFPPRVSDNVLIGGKRFLSSRIARCARERGVAAGVVAVYFYERSAVVEVARELDR